MKKCIYCGCGVDESSVIDFCQKCGVRVFGDKMFKAIIENMENAREKGDLYQGNVTGSTELNSDEKQNFLKL